MKNLKRTHLLIVCVAVFLIISTSFCACFSSNGSSSSKKTAKTSKKTTSVTLNTGSSSNSVTATIDEELSVAIPAKSDYYFIGYYDSENGGECYINNEGISNSVWQEGFPSKLYAHWDSIDNLYYSNNYFVSETYRYGFYSKSFKYNLPTDFKNAIKGNLNRTIKVIVHFESKQKAGSFNIADCDLKLCDDQDDYGAVLSKYNFTAPSEYKNYDVTMSTSAKGLKNGYLYLIFDLGYSNTSFFLRGLSIEIKF